jgi:hypothetical protein
MYAMLSLQNFKSHYLRYNRKQVIFFTYQAYKNLTQRETCAFSAAPFFDGTENSISLAQQSYNSLQVKAWFTKLGL